MQVGNAMSMVSAAMLLFLVMDPLGNVPLFLAALKNVPPHRVSRVILRECTLALGVLLAFLAVGRQLLALLGLTQPALGVAGGVVLLLVSLRMVFPSPEHALQEPVVAEPFPGTAGDSLHGRTVVAGDGHAVHVQGTRPLARVDRGGGAGVAGGDADSGFGHAASPSIGRSRPAGGRASDGSAALGTVSADADDRGGGIPADIARTLSQGRPESSGIASW